ncbi:MAG: hypothetical protein ACR2GT_04475, partial [Gaiellaceae bacterium]
VDTLSLDPGNATAFVAHVALLAANRFGIENLANLGRIPPEGATAFVGVIPWGRAPAARRGWLRPGELERVAFNDQWLLTLADSISGLRRDRVGPPSVRRSHKSCRRSADFARGGRVLKGGWLSPRPAPQIVVFRVS